MKTELCLEDQATLDLHKIMLEAMRARESEILHFMGFFLTAIVGFIAAIGWLIGKESTPHPGELIPMLFVPIILILFFGAWYALSLSFNYRYIQLSTWYLQEYLNLTRFQPNWEPKEFNPERLKCFNFAPEILRTQVLFFFALIIVAILFLLYAFLLFELIFCSLSSLLYLGVCLEAVLALYGIRRLGYKFYPQKYNKLKDEVSNNFKASADKTDL